MEVAGENSRRPWRERVADCDEFFFKAAERVADG